MPHTPTHTGLAGGTITDEVRRQTGIGGQTSLEKRRAFCLSQGGKWDSETNTCSTIKDQETEARQKRIEGARETVAPTVTPVEPTAEIPPTTRQPLPSPVDALIGPGSPAGELVAAGAGQTLTPEAKEFLGTAIPAAGGGLVAGLGGAAALQAAAPNLVSSIGNFLTRAKAVGQTAAARAAPGSRALGTNPRALGTNPRAVVGAIKNTAVINAPREMLKQNTILRGAIKTGLGIFGVGSLGVVSNTVLTGNIARVEAEVSKVGEQLTKIPESVRLGIRLNEEGQVEEYTPSMGLADITEVRQSLDDAEIKLKESTIGRAFLRITGRGGTAQAEIDKQRKEIDVAEGKILNEIAVPSEKLLEVREFFRDVELLE